MTTSYEDKEWYEEPIEHIPSERINKWYAISEWYGEPFIRMSPERRQTMANIALGKSSPPPVCPFQPGNPQCKKKGGVCSIQTYRKPPIQNSDRLGLQVDPPVITCPRRFDQNNLIPKWLAQIVGFDRDKFFFAREVPFMRSPDTGRPAGRIDLVIANNKNASMYWFGLEIQAVYFSGRGMGVEFERLAQDIGQRPPIPVNNRRPDWRSSGAKRLMPQLQVKAPTLRRWGTKLAVSVDMPFFEAIGGPSHKPSRDLDEGDIIWLVPEISDDYQLEAVHWEVLSLEESSKKLLAAQTVKRKEFEEALRAKLQSI